MDSKNAHSTVLKGPQLMNSSFVLNSIPASGSGKTCLPWACAATLGCGAPERRRSKSGEPRADSEASQKRSVSLIKVCYKMIGQQRLCVPDDTTSRPSKPTTFSSPHYLLGIFISGAALLPKEDQKARWKNKSRRHPTKFNSIQKWNKNCLQTQIPPEYHYFSVITSGKCWSRKRLGRDPAVYTIPIHIF
jgi:hypothetical protein